MDEKICRIDEMEAEQWTEMGWWGHSREGFAGDRAMG
jgi:hypothetical protein